MPRQKDLKRVIRARMQKTGEAYTTARAQILERRPVKKAASAAQGTYARLAGMSDAAVAKRTGCTWERWVRTLDHVGAAEMSHAEIAAFIRERWAIGDWWSQMVAVGYERVKGLRERGQRRSGHYEASKTKTFNVPVERVFEAVIDAAHRHRWLPDATSVRTATAHRSVRLKMNDGAIAALGFTRKGDTKTTLSVQQEKLPDRATQERVKAYWGKRLTALAEFLA